MGKYDIQHYMESLLDSIGDAKTRNSMRTEDGHVRKELVDLVRCSIGRNPRSVKRLINTFTLLTYMEKDNHSSAHYKLLFSTLCMQLAYESI